MYSRVKKEVALKMSTNALVQIAYACITRVLFIWGGGGGNQGIFPPQKDMFPPNYFKASNFFNWLSSSGLIHTTVLVSV